MSCAVKAVFKADTCSIKLGGRKVPCLWRLVAWGDFLSGVVSTTGNTERRGVEVWVVAAEVVLLEEELMLDVVVDEALDGVEAKNEEEEDEDAVAGRARVVVMAGRLASGMPAAFDSATTTPLTSPPFCSSKRRDIALIWQPSS